ncbi:MAG: hypothetical protein QM723_23045 [Myxococcaceae bacterium]
MKTPIAHISLQSFNGQFVSSRTGALLASAKKAGPHETFAVIALPNRRVALRANNGKYVSIDYRHGHALFASATEVGESESFRLEDLGQGNVAIHGYCWTVCAENGGGRELVANKQKAGQWETFKQVLVVSETLLAAG